jgi:hypothetical protein
VRMLLERKDFAGQSLYIGLAKTLGTPCPSILQIVYLPESLLTIFSPARSSSSIWRISRCISGKASG